MSEGGNLHETLVSYLLATGWLASERSGPAGRPWSHPGADWVVPVPETISTSDWLWDDIVRRLARAENREPHDIESALQGWRFDVTDLRAANDLVVDDSIPLEAGVQMVDSAWAMLRACATTSMGSKAHIRGNYRRLADLQVGSARMAHTRRGSYVIPILMPLTVESEQGERLPGTERVAPEPAQRRITRTFAEALNGVRERIIEPDREARANDIADLITSGVSYEFMAALHKVVSEESVSSFSADFRWSAAFPAPASLPPRIEVPAAAATLIRRASERLKQPPTQRRAELLTGPVIEVRHIPDEPLGSAAIQTSRNGRIVHVRATISQHLVPRALSWMRTHETVVIEGAVRREASGLVCTTKDAIRPLAEVMLPDVAMPPVMKPPQKVPSMPTKELEAGPSPAGDT